MSERIFDAKARNRALLSRQLLLRRTALSPVGAVERLVGLQAQTPASPYTALWSRLTGFDPRTLSRAIETRKLVRIALMRSTIHLVSAADAVYLRPLVQTVIDRELANPTWRVPLEGVDLGALTQLARAILEQRPSTPAKLGFALAEHFAGREPRALAHAARTLLPLVQVPPRGLWQHSGATTLTTAEHWLGARLRDDATWDEVAVRYLRAFGPATAADLVAWSRVTGLADVFARLRPRLLVLHDTNGRELFDLPRAPRPPATTPAPPRFLPDYDNLLLSHADRNFVFPDAHRATMRSTNGVVPGSVLVDGSVRATWSIERADARARLRIRALEDLHGNRDEIRDEARGLLQLLAPEASHTEIRFG